MTPAEKLLWERIRDKRLDGMKFRRQQVIAGFIADFYCHAFALALELDGATHEKEHDAYRDAAFAAKGIRTLRIANAEVYQDVENVLQRIVAFSPRSQS
jgi:very-short-patch-repair endonuclease